MSDITEQIRDEIAKNKILIYMKGARNFPECGFSAATIAVFERLGRPFETVNVLTDPERREAIKLYSQWPTIPQVYVDGKFIGGNDIVQELFASGDLHQLVDRAFS
jgi:monothiol glutaredoxin